MYCRPSRLFALFTCSLALSVMLCGVAIAKPVLPDFVELAKKLKPTVVNISTAKTIKPQRRFQRPFNSPFGNDPFQDFFDRFFDESQQHPYKQKSLGSGFIISDEAISLPTTMWLPKPMKSRSSSPTGESSRGKSREPMKNSIWRC